MRETSNSETRPTRDRASARSSGQRARRTFGAAALLLGSLGMIAAPQASLAATCTNMPTVSLQIYPGNVENIPAWVMTHEGFLARHCLKGELDSVSSGPAATAAAVQGSADFISLSPDTVFTPRSKGINLKIVASTNNTVFFTMMLPAQSPLVGKPYKEIMKGLVGKTIGVNAIGSTTYYFARANFLGAGLSPDSATYVALGPIPPTLAALKHGTVQAAEFSGTGNLTALATGIAVMVPGADYENPKAGPPMVRALTGACLLWVGYAPWLNSHVKIVKEFVAANREAIAWAKNPANRKQLYALVQKLVPLPASVPHSHEALRKIVDGYVAQLSTHTSMSALEAWNKYAVYNGEYKKPISVKDAIFEPTSHTFLSH